VGANANYHSMNSKQALNARQTLLSRTTDIRSAAMGSGAQHIEHSACHGTSVSWAPDAATISRGGDYILVMSTPGSTVVD